MPRETADEVGVRYPDADAGDAGVEGVRKGAVRNWMMNREPLSGEVPRISRVRLSSNSVSVCRRAELITLHRPELVKGLVRFERAVEATHR